MQNAPATTKTIRRLGATLLAAAALAACGSTGSASSSADTDPARPAAATASDNARTEHVQVGKRLPPHRDGTSAAEPTLDRDRQGAAGTSSTSDRESDATSAGTEVRVLHRYDEYANAAGTTNWSSMYEMMAFVIHDATNAFWGPLLTAEGRPAPVFDYQLPLPGEVSYSSCGASDDSSMSFCPADDTIQFSQQAAIDLWNGTFRFPDGKVMAAPGGDFAVAYFVAHEVAHGVQEIVGISAATYGVTRMELHADCWAGVWARSAEQRNLLDPGDVAEGWVASWFGGDTTTTHPQHHGTPDQRATAFVTGYANGTPSTCDQFLA